MDQSSYGIWVINIKEMWDGLEVILMLDDLEVIWGNLFLGVWDWIKESYWYRVIYSDLPTGAQKLQVKKNL